MIELNGMANYYFVTFYVLEDAKNGSCIIGGENIEVVSVFHVKIVLYNFIYSNGIYVFGYHYNRSILKLPSVFFKLNVPSCFLFLNW